MAAVTEEYTEDSPKFGDVSELSAFELGEGEPTKQREELKEDEETDIPSAVEEEADKPHYGKTDEQAEHFEDLTEESVQEAVTSLNETFVDAMEDYLSMSESDYLVSL